MKRNVSVLVKPASSRCNLACAYCFYLEKAALYPWEGRPALSLDTFEAFLRQYMEGFAQPYTFAWQGGEPTLMGLPFFQAAVQLEARVAREVNPGSLSHISNAIQTNGVQLDDDWARFFKESNFLVGVSVDGPPEMHDRYRTDRTGRPSHRAAMDGVEHLRRRGVEFNILTVVSSANVEHPEELLGWLVGQRFRQLQFIPLVEPLPGHTSVVEAGALPGSITPQQYGRFLERLFDAWVAAGSDSVRIRWFDNLVQLLWGHPAETCEMARRCGMYVVLEHNGDCYPCDFFVQGEWLLGNVLETPLEKIVNSAIFHRFRRMKSRLHPECRDCPWLSLCHGECPRYRITGSGRAEGALPYFCPSFRHFFESRYNALERVAVSLGRRLGLPV
ncbi:MAG: anaerobic sulfatase maturase, partial [Gemmatimonadetes bacterium]|nr:anaerobic sulfatase maturase [Gemmatimonadota bacterium]